MKPVDILYDTIVLSPLYDKKGKYSTPGSVILNLSEEKRETLKQLKSEDIENARNFWVEVPKR